MQTRKATSYGGQSVWAIDPTHTTVAFSIDSFLFLKVNGSFADVAGTLVLDEEDVRRSSVVATIKGKSIKTGSMRRDAHLRAEDFLDVDRYPDIIFQSSQVKPGTDRDMLGVVGKLTIKEKSREVALNVGVVDRSCSPSGEEVVYYTAMTELDRFDFGIKYGRGAIGRKVRVVINFQALKQV
jgi:polyisoprenoid-binding protein YceI